MSVRLEASANPAMLEWARSEKGLDLPVAAQKAGVKPDKLERFERGDERPSVAQLRKLANVYKRPLGVFFLATAPPRTPLPPDYRTLNSGTVAAMSAELRMEVRMARYRRQVALDLYDEIGEHPPDVPIQANLGDDPEHLSRRVRDWLGADRFEPQIDHRRAFNRWRDALEARGVLVFQARQVPLEEMRGFALAERPLPVVVANLADVYPARSFTLLHELVHVLLGESALCLPPGVFEEDTRTEIGRIEAFCNRVAGAVLAPRDALLEEPSLQGTPSSDAIYALARRFGVSREVVVRRLLILGRVSADFYRERRSEYQAEFEKRPAKKDGRGPPPATLAVSLGGRAFARLVLEAYDEDRITTSEVSDFLGVKATHVPRIRQCVTARATEDEEDA